ncbi:MAG TPA: 7-carboxy-7-deazaguanine synthase QueE [Polyangiaceae bacterium]|nr:7-carboxy-7-deazaguanine synthase QueE [Polyangiaceae bacterium]
MKLARLGDGPEIFFSLQGEGKNQGAPSVFVRTSRCNLYCAWCDTPYTWNWTGTAFVHESAPKFDMVAQTIELDVAEVAQIVRRFPCRRLVLTGGEPLLQASDCAALVRELRSDGARYAVEVETNGTLLPPAELEAVLDQYTVSPKLESSAVERSLRLRAEALAFFAAAAKSVFKFVVAGGADVAEVGRIVSEHAIDPDRVYLMPKASSAEELRKLSPSVAAACLAAGYRFSDRLHIHLFGNRPGV